MDSCATCACGDVPERSSTVECFFDFFFLGTGMNVSVEISSSHFERFLGVELDFAAIRRGRVCIVRKRDSTQK